MFSIRGPLLALVALVLGGCLESEETIRLRPDGSGSIRQTWTIDPAGREALLQSATERVTGVRLEPGALPPADPVAPEWIRHRARGVEGYRIRRVDERAQEETRVVTVEADFSTLEAAARAGAFWTAAVRLEREDDAWRFTYRDVWEAAASDERGEIAGQPYAELLEALAPALEGFALTRLFEFPAPVRETNGQLLPDGRTVRWRVDRKALKARQGLKLEVVFARNEKQALQPFRHRPDPERLVARLLEAPPGTSRRPADADAAPAPDEE